MCMMSSPKVVITATVVGSGGRGHECCRGPPFLGRYGYSLKGASVVLYRDARLRSYQFFAYADWPGGLFGSPSMAGTRLVMLFY
jgi:hypothetical protein